MRFGKGYYRGNERKTAAIEWLSYTDKTCFTSFCLVKVGFCMEDGKAFLEEAFCHKARVQQSSLIFFTLYCIKNEINCSVHWSLLAVEKYLTSNCVNGADGKVFGVLK